MYPFFIAAPSGGFTEQKWKLLIFVGVYKKGLQNNDQQALVLES